MTTPLVSAAAHDDLVRCDFTASGPNWLWLRDISERPTSEGKLYICAVKDVWSSRIVGYSIAERMTSQLAVDAVESVVARRGRSGAIRCSGRWVRLAPPGDNAATEIFFSLLQRNVLGRRRWSTREELPIAIVTWIERTYHLRRKQVRLDRLTPIEFEAIMT